jgi:hypothetical protein
MGENTVVTYPEFEAAVRQHVGIRVYDLVPLLFATLCVVVAVIRDRRKKKPN